MMKLALCNADLPANLDTERLARELALPWYPRAEDLPADCSHVLWVSASGLALGKTGSKVPASTRVDFLDGTLQYRLRTSGKRQGLGKAVGLDKAAGIKVLDATAGLGRDALVLAHLGCEVTLQEKSPVMHALLADGLCRARAAASGPFAATLARMTLVKGDARERFAAIGQGLVPQPDVIYLDPMFPPRGKSASVKKDIAMLQELLGAEEDFAALLAAASACARHRVVVKRPGGSVAGKGGAGERMPAFIVPGKSAHFEVYVNSSFSSMR